MNWAAAGRMTGISLAVFVTMRGAAGAQKTPGELYVPSRPENVFLVGFQSTALRS